MSETSADLTVENLKSAGLDEQFDAIEEAVGRHVEGKVANIAVVSEPFAGREIFLDYAEQEFGAAVARVTFDEILTGDLPDFPNAEIILVDNCQYLYQREVGGFEMLQEFLDFIATRDSLYVTSWNRYAWSYLTAVSDVEAAFPETIQIPRLDASQVRDLLQSYHGTPLPMFEEVRDTGQFNTLDLDWHSVEFGERSLAVPTPRVNSEYFLSRFRTDAKVDVEAAVYQRIAQLSEGDPGVATILWDRSVREDSIAPSYVREVQQSLETDRDEAFILEVILTNESIAYDRLDEISGDVSVDQALQTLLKQGVVTIDDGDRIHIEPTRIYSTVEHLERRQLVW